MLAEFRRRSRPTDTRSAAATMAPSMNPQPPQYLVRLDDFCPTMLEDRRERFLSILARHGVSPILAVVPDNQDPDLIRQSPDPQFWDRMRSLQAAGAAIAMHGYRHICASRGVSILGLHQETEFAGVDPSLQQHWLRSGLAILHGQGLQPRLFVAPRHGFDRNTLRALAAEGLNVLSDGFARRPFIQTKSSGFRSNSGNRSGRRPGSGRSAFTPTPHLPTSRRGLRDSSRKTPATSPDSIR